MRRSLVLLPLSAAALVLTGCTKDRSGFASLARRPAERITTPDANASPTPAPSPAAPDPALLARVDELVAKARVADQRFRSRTGAARSLVAAAAGAPVASESWSVATVALSELETARSEAVIALAGIDEIYARAVVEGTDSDVLRNAREAVVALVAEQDAVLADLGGRLAS